MSCAEYIWCAPRTSLLVTGVESSASPSVVGRGAKTFYCWGVVVVMIGGSRGGDKYAPEH